MIYYDDERDYSWIIKSWIYDFVFTMDDGVLRPGNNSGEAPDGVKIIFDGYGENDDGESDYNTLSFAVFVHKDSLTEDFPPHDVTPFGLIHRPKEEVCIWVWYDNDSHEVTVIPFEDNSCTEMDRKETADLIFKIAERDGLEEEE